MTAESFPVYPPFETHEGIRLPDCDLIVILENEYATSADETRTEIERLTEIPQIDWRKGKIDFKVIPTEPERTDTITSIASAVGEARDKKPDIKIGLIAAGGDYAQNIGLEAALLNSIDVVGLYAGGNVNALPKMANTGNRSTDMVRLIRYGETAPIHPIETVITLPNGLQKIRRFFAFAGGGITSAVAKSADSESHRETTRNMSEIQIFTEEAKIVLEKVGNIEPLILEDEAGIRKILDFSIVNGSKLAKAVRIGRNPLTAPRAAMIEIGFPESSRTSARLALTGIAIAKGMAGIYDKIKLGDDPYEFSLKTDGSKSETFSFHFEGQPYDFPNGTEFAVQIIPDVVSIQTNRPHLVHRKHR
jgi:hypothetical protein